MKKVGGLMITLLMLLGACASGGSSKSGGAVQAEPGVRSDQAKSAGQDFSSDDEFLNQRLQAEKTRGFK